MTEKINKSYNMTPAELAIIEVKANEILQVSGDKNDSAALRAIIREWAKLTGKEIPQPQPTQTQ